MTVMAGTVLCASHHSKSTPIPERDEWPPDKSEPGHASRHETGAVHQVTEYQSIPPADDEAGA
jgi:hypothetical protein